jgi:rRNA maturation RNase YbeY
MEIEDEVLLYGLHGLLHLAGYDDLKPAAAKEMAAAQEKLLRRVRRPSG